MPPSNGGSVHVVSIQARKTPSHERRAFFGHLLPHRWWLRREGHGKASQTQLPMPTSNESIHDYFHAEIKSAMMASTKSAHSETPWSPSQSHPPRTPQAHMSDMKFYHNLRIYSSMADGCIQASNPFWQLHAWRV